MEEVCRGESISLLGHGGDALGRRCLPEGMVWLLFVLLHAPGENPRSSDRAVALFLRRVLLEDAVLELSACGSPRVTWRRRGASALTLRLLLLGKAFFVLCVRLSLSGSILVLQRCFVGGFARFMVVAGLWWRCLRRWIVSTVRNVLWFPVLG